MEKLIGQTIKDYELREYVAGGGFGDVYRARQLSVQRDVAMKVITPRYANQPDFIRRFEAEAQIIARLESPYIVPLYNYWREPDGAYLVMRWLGGGSLYNRLASQGALSIEEAVDVINNVTKALHIAHRNQVIHRDIKPGNILLDEDDYAYLTDFGIAKDHARAEAMTEDGMLMGTFDYLAPEQAQSDAVMPATDVYSLGIVLYEMLEGHHPFSKASHIEMLYKNLSESLPDITVLDASIRDSVNAVIQKATDKNPERRYQDVLTFAQALRQAAQLDTTPVLTSPIELLTPREQDVLKLMLQGKTNRQIADSLVVELATIKGYNTNIYRKLGVRSKGQALAKARQMEWFTGKRLAPPSTSLDLLPEPQNPYKGLEEFQAGDTHNFFGRKRITEKLLQRLCEDVPYYRFLAVVGPSGSGKSSLVRAGLTPALWRGDLPDSDNWYITDMLPGSHPFDKLEVALVKVADNKTLNLRDHLSRDARGLLRVADMMLPDDDSELLIVIDQFEEVFTLVEDEDDRRHFLALLHTAMTDKRSRVRVVVTLRADYYDRPLMYPEFGDMLRQRVETVLPLSAEELEQAITAPVKQQAVKFEAGLVSRIVADVNYQPGALPLLQYALTELFERRDGRILTMEAYQAIGGTGGALAKRADEIYLEYDESGRELVRQLFLRLVTLGEGAEDTRRRVLRSELLAVASPPLYSSVRNEPALMERGSGGEVMDEIIDEYAQSRLLALDHDPITREPTVEVAHEAILREWDTLRLWLNDSRDDIRQQRIVAQAAADWDAHGQDSSFLLRGIRLEQAEKWHKTSALNLTPLESEYVAASIAQRKYETDLELERIREKATQEKRLQRMLIALVAVFAIATVVSIGFGIFAWNRQSIATEALEASNQSSAEFRSIALSFGAKDALNNYQPDVALSLSAEAMRLNTPPLHAVTTYNQVSQTNWMRHRFVGGHSSNSVWDAAFLHDGEHVITTGFTDNTINKWNIDSGEVVQSIDLGQAAGAVTVHPEIDIVAIASLANQQPAGILIWDVENDERFTLGQDLSRTFLEPEFSPDGTHLFSSSGGTVYIWDVATRQLVDTILVFEGENEVIQHINLSDDGALLTAACRCPAVKIVDIASGEVLQTLIFPQGVTAWTSDFLPDSDYVLVGVVTQISYVQLWNWQTNTRVWEIEYSDHPTVEWPRYLEVSPDDNWFAIAMDANSLPYAVELREVETGNLLHRYHGHTSRVAHVHYSHDGQSLITTSRDGTAAIWSVLWEGAESVIELPENTDLGLSVHPTQPLFTFPALTGGMVYLGNYETGAILQSWEVGNGGIISPTFSLDGRYIVSGEHDASKPIEDQHAYIWDSQSGALLFTLDKHDGWIRDIAFSPTESIAAVSQGLNNHILLWQLETGELLQRLQGPHSDWVNAIAYSPDGNSLYSGDQNGVLVQWDVHTGEVVRQFEGHTNAITNLDVDSSGNRLLSSGVTTYMWDLQSGEIIATLIGNELSEAQFSPDSTRIATLSKEPALQIWGAETGQLLQSYGIHNNLMPSSITFTPDGEHILSTANNYFIVWDITNLEASYDVWIAANRYIPDFTCDQRELYHIEPLCEE